MRSLLLFFSLTLLCSRSIGQYEATQVKKKATELYTQALAQAQEGHYREGILLLQQAIRIDGKYADAYLSLGGMYGELKNYDSAILHYEKAHSIDSNYFRDYNLPYSINLAGKGQFQKALQAINSFLHTPNLNEQSLLAANYRKKCYQFALDYGKQHKLNEYLFRPQNLGPEVNSPYSEYYPSLTLDAEELVFTRRINDFNEDFYESHAAAPGIWEEAAELEGRINTAQNEGAQNISQDGEWLIFTACNRPDGLGSCDLYISYLTEVGWSRPENFGEPVNTESWESAPSLSPDKRDLYFTSSRPGGYGGSDIYVSHRLSDGSFGEPENLGPTVNTSGNESSPFIHADNQTLFFTSNGHPGYGGDDLFVSRKGPKGLWSEASNLGYPINTIENEGSLVVAADGKTAYYASDRNEGYGGLDLYTFELREEIRPARTFWIEGHVYDKPTRKGLPSAVELIDLTTRQPLSKVQTDETGYYLITLPAGKDYAFNVNRKGYLFYSENFSLRSKLPDSVYQIDIFLQPLENNAGIVLKNIFFETNLYNLREESTAELDKVVQLLRENPALRIEISGHTDNTGKVEDNIVLSQNRAQSVINYIIRQGIAAERLVSKGYGFSRPVATNDTPEGRAQNRRTELKILSH
ncbi:MAG: OmpA family protein [Chitinophagaceae bacterium]